MSNFPDFQDFLATLDQDTVQDILKDANRQAKMVEFHPGIQPQSIPGLQVSSMAFSVALELVGCYHKWLSQSL